MGGVWCRVDRGNPPSYDSRGPFSSTISRWTDQVRQVYRKPKTRHRPPKPPQKPIRSNDRLTISPPRLVKEQSSDGWRTATLIVPQTAPIPPPRKKKKVHLQELARTAYSMYDLNTHPRELNKSTFSLQERYSVECGLNSTIGSSSTIIVTPILESRVSHKPEAIKIEEIMLTKGKDDKIREEESDESKKEEDEIMKYEEIKQVKNEEDKIIKANEIKTIKHEEDETLKENLHRHAEKNSEGEYEDNDEVDLGDEIIPVEKETMFTYRTLQYSNLGYIDKLSAISEVSAESGFDDKTDIGRFSEKSESVASDDIITSDVGLNIIEPIHITKSITQEAETMYDVREKTAKSKKAWLENILREESLPYLLPTVEEKKHPENELLHRLGVVNSFVPASSRGSNLNLDKNTFETDNKENEISTANQDSSINHSVLLGILQKNDNSFLQTKKQPYSHEGESIFLTNTKTNIIYKSLSSDNLTDDYENDYLMADKKCVMSSNCDTVEEIIKTNSNCTDMVNSKCTIPLYNSINGNSAHTTNHTVVHCESDPKAFIDDNNLNVVSSFDFKDIINRRDDSSTDKHLQSSIDTETPKCTNIVINVVHSEPEQINIISDKENNENLSVKEQNKRSSAASSRRSSLTDSLHEFEISIYDMLKESNKYLDSSDEEESIKTIKSVAKP